MKTIMKNTKTNIREYIEDARKVFDNFVKTWTSVIKGEMR